jgi:hypothetical protein
MNAWILIAAMLAAGTATAEDLPTAEDTPNPPAVTVESAEHTTCELLTAVVPITFAQARSRSGSLTREDSYKMLDLDTSATDPLTTYKVGMVDAIWATPEMDQKQFEKDMFEHCMDQKLYRE